VELPSGNTMYKVELYCPDDHISYNLRTLEEIGVGGGITARIRLAHALADLGHQVSLDVNCPKDETIRNVEYRHYSEVKDIQTDIAIFSSSGGGLDLGGLSEINISARMKIVLVHGVTFPRNIRPEDFDFVYVLSNFIRKIAISEWKIDPRKIFVTYRGVKKSNSSEPLQERDPYKLVYFGHPSKGLDAAINVLRLLRRINPQFTLHIFGGNRLWGQKEAPMPEVEGIVFYGLTGQKELAGRLLGMGFSLNLQSREEPFGMVVTESMNAGCVVIASPVGAFPEIISDCEDGFLIPGPYSDPETQELAARLINDLVEKPEEMRRIQMNAQRSPLSWETIVQSWTAHWDSHLVNKTNNQNFHPYDVCPDCGGGTIYLPDGIHCLSCGLYRKRVVGTRQQHE
jgi:glycosyltransferase involved in cell wall biosynthesis